MQRDYIHEKLKPTQERKIVLTFCKTKSHVVQFPKQEMLTFIRKAFESLTAYQQFLEIQLCVHGHHYHSTFSAAERSRGH